MKATDKLDQKSAKGKMPDEAALAKESENQVIRSLEKLPTNQKEVVVLKFQNDLSYKEINQITGLSISNIGYLIHTAIKTLQSELKMTGGSL